MNTMIENKKVVWITGGGTGIGKELAILLAKKDWQVIISGRRQDKLKEVEKQNNKNISALRLDITDSDECKEVAHKIIKKFGALDLVILNAAAYNPGNLDFNQLSTIKEVVNINLIGQINCISAIIPSMKKRKSGQILIVSSPAGFRGLPNAGIYGVTKSALTFLAETLYLEFSKFSVKIQVLHPGFVDTPMTKKNKFPMPFILTSKEAAERIEKKIHTNSFEICFPKRLIIPMKLMRFLPNKLYFFFLKKIL